MQPKAVIKYGGCTYLYIYINMGRIILIKKVKKKYFFTYIWMEYIMKIVCYILRPDRQLCQYFHGGIHFSMKFNLYTYTMVGYSTQIIV